MAARRKQHARSRGVSWMRLFVPAMAVALLVRSSTAAEPAPEYDVKAAFLLNFTKFVEWPPNAFADSRSQLVLCILGKDPFGRALDEVVQGEAVNGHTLTIRRIAQPPVPQTCQVVFVDPELKDVAKILAGLPSGVLTVGEGDRFAREGGMIALVVDNRRVRFDINPAAAQNGGLKLSSRLLNVARSIVKIGMRAFRDRPIKQKLVIVTLVTTVTALALAGLGIVVVDSLLFRSYLRRDLTVLARVIADNSTASLAFNDPKAAAQTLAAVKERSHIVGACIYRNMAQGVAIVFTQYSPNRALTCLSNLREVIREASAVVTADDLPEVYMGEVHLQQLFSQSRFMHSLCGEQRCRRRGFGGKITGGKTAGAAGAVGRQECLAEAPAPPSVTRRRPGLGGSSRWWA